MIDEVLLHVAHHAHGEFGREDAGVLRLVLLEDVRLNGAAHLGQGLASDRVVFLLRQDTQPGQTVAGDAQQAEAAAIMPRRQFTTIGRRRKPTRARCVAHLLDNRLCLLPASVLPEIAFDLLINGSVHEHRQNDRRRTIDRHGHRGGGLAQIEARIKLLHVIERRHRHARVTGPSVDVRARIRIFAVERG
jgi:hypothetical protein